MSLALAGGPPPRPRGVLALPPQERPRERLQSQGPGALSNGELLAVLLGSGCGGRSALELGRELAGRGLRGLAAASVDELGRVRGLGPAGATRVRAALELGARLAGEERPQGTVFRSPEETGRYLLPRYAARPVEAFGLLLLDVRHALLRERVVSVGCLTSSLVHPREVFREALDARAAAVVAFHNHPSGDPEPSAEDLALTRRLAAAGSLMGVELLDHLVLGAGRFVSLKQRGLL